MRSWSMSAARARGAAHLVDVQLELPRDRRRRRGAAT